MATVRVEWITLGIDPLKDLAHDQIIKSVEGSAESVTATTTAVQSSAAPSVSGLLYTRLTATSGNAVVAWGDDPTATQTNSILIVEGGVEVVPIAPGGKVSVLEFV